MAREERFCCLNAVAYIAQEKSINGGISGFLVSGGTSLGQGSSITTIHQYMLLPI